MSKFPTLMTKATSPPTNQSIGKDFNVSLVGTTLAFGKKQKKINLKSEVKVDFRVALSLFCPN